MDERLSKSELEAFESLLDKLHLPTHIHGYDVLEVLEGTKNDKKMEAGSIKFILLERIGKGYIDNTVTDEEMRDAISYLMK